MARAIVGYFVAMAIVFGAASTVYCGETYGVTVTVPFDMKRIKERGTVAFSYSHDNASHDTYIDESVTNMISNIDNSSQSSVTNNSSSSVVNNTSNTTVRNTTTTNNTTNNTSNTNFNYNISTHATTNTTNNTTHINQNHNSGIILN